MSELTLIYTLIAIFIWFLGASIFSFFNVVIYRVPRKMSFVQGFSHCPSCGHRLYAKDMVPVFSWLFLRGRCRYCKAPVSARYSVIESLGGCLAILCVQHYVFAATTAPIAAATTAPIAAAPTAPIAAAVTAFAFLGMLSVVACVDLDTMEIPNEFQLVILALALIAIFTMPGLTLASRIIGFFCVSVPMTAINVVVPGGFGGGDVKLMAVCGLFLGWKLILIALFFGIMSGGFYGMYLLVGRKKGRKEHFAFGPFLCAGMAISLFCGEQLLGFYLKVCGF